LGPFLSTQGLTVCIQEVSVIFGQLLEARLHETKAVYLLGRRLFVSFEELKEGRAFPRINPPTFHDDEARNAQTKAIDVGYLCPFRKPSGGTVKRLISRRTGISDAARPKIAF